jgi:zinc transport system substrate-binding protein
MMTTPPTTMRECRTGGLAAQRLVPVKGLKSRNRSSDLGVYALLSVPGSSIPVPGRLRQGRLCLKVTAPFLALSAVLMLLVGCGGGSGRHAAVRSPDGRPRIVATIAPLADIARRVAGGTWEVVTLVPPGASPHTWEPSPRDAEIFSKARVFFEVGLGYEAWLSKIVERGGNAVIVDGSAGLDPIRGNGRETHISPGGSVGQDAPSVEPKVDAGGKPVDGGPGARTGGGANPHWWLDPIAMKSAALRLGEVLAVRDPGRADDYRGRAAHVAADLDGLDAELRARISQFPSKKIVTFHAAWDYMARRYGITILASIEESPGREPGPQFIAEIVRLVRENDLRALFAEPQFPAKAAEAIAGECDVKVLVLDPLGGEGVPGRGDYLSLMRYNVGVMERALK